MSPAELAVVDRNHSPVQVSQPDPFEPQTWPEMLKFAEMVSKTNFAPKDFQGKPEACAIAMLYGRQLGVGGLQAIQNIAVINGRPSVYGDLFWAIIINHPDFVDVEEKSDDKSAWVKLTRRNRSPKEATFTQQDAVTAGLWKKAGPWTNYPSVMMLWRARTFAGRFLFADALRGMTSSHEAEDFQGETIEGTVSANATPAPNTAPEQKKDQQAKITQDQARDFGKAWKASGYAMAEAKEALKRICGVESSLDIPAARYQDAMDWAATVQEQPQEQKEATPEISHEEQQSREAFGVMGWDQKVQARFVEQYSSDWKKILGEMRILVMKRKEKDDF